jgi:hypothetical protein
MAFLVGFFAIGIAVMAFFAFQECCASHDNPSTELFVDADPNARQLLRCFALVFV